MTDQARRASCRVLLVFNCLLLAAAVLGNLLTTTHRTGTPAEYTAPAPDLPDWPVHRPATVAL